MTTTKAAQQRLKWEREKRDLRNLTGLRIGLYARASHDPTGRAKSVTDQMGVGRREITGLGATVAGEYDRDNDRSASRYGTKAREDFEQLLTDIQAGKMDGVWFWDLSRSQRRLDVYVRLRDLCRDKGVVWLIGGRVYDLNNYMDVQALGYDAVNNEVFSEKLSANVCRGKASSAMAGKPSGKNVYGYVRIYDPHTKELIEVKRDETPHTAKGKDGKERQYTHAGIVVEVFKSYAGGSGLRAIALGLEDRGIPTPRGAPHWWPQTVRAMLKNHVYSARQVHRREALDDVTVMWPPISTSPDFEEIYQAVHRTFNESASGATREGRARHLLGNIAKCVECEAAMNADMRTNDDDGRRARYFCRYRGCVGVDYDDLNSFVEERVVGWLSSAEVLDHLAHQEDDGEAAEARAEAERLRGEVETWRRLSENGEADPITANRSIKNLLALAEKEDERAETATVPPVLRGVIGADAAEKWIDLDLEVKRKIIRTVAEIVVHKIGPEGSGAPVKTRVGWRWLLGPEPRDVPPAPSSSRNWRDVAAEERAREIFAEELATGLVPTRKKFQTLAHMGWERAERIRAILVAELEGSETQK